MGRGRGRQHSPRLGGFISQGWAALSPEVGRLYSPRFGRLYSPDAGSHSERTSICLEEFTGGGWLLFIVIARVNVAINPRDEAEGI